MPGLFAPMGQGSFFGGGRFDIPSSFWAQPVSAVPTMTGTPEGGLSLQALQALGLGGGLLAPDFPAFNQYGLGPQATAPTPEPTPTAAPQMSDEDIWNAWNRIATQLNY